MEMIIKLGVGGKECHEFHVPLSSLMGQLKHVLSIQMTQKQLKLFFCLSDIPVTLHFTVTNSTLYQHAFQGPISQHFYI